MQEDKYPYHQWVNEALLNVFRQALKQLSIIGSYDDHHFFIDINTKHKGVSIPKFLHAQYPERITIVLQHQFDDLVVDEHCFEVSLSFNGKKSRLKVPFDAVTSFADPSVNFGLQISNQSNNDEITSNETMTKSNKLDPNHLSESDSGLEPLSNPGKKPKLHINKDAAEEREPVPEISIEESQDNLAQTAEVITLDAFRKK